MTKKTTPEQVLTEQLAEETARLAVVAASNAARRSRDQLLSLGAAGELLRCLFSEAEDEMTKQDTMICRCLSELDGIADDLSAVHARNVQTHKDALAAWHPSGRACGHVCEED